VINSTYFRKRQDKNEEKSYWDKAVGLVSFVRNMVLGAFGVALEKAKRDKSNDYFYYTCEE
jgi:hypothetical protein